MHAYAVGVDGYLRGARQAALDPGVSPVARRRRPCVPRLLTPTCGVVTPAVVSRPPRPQLSRRPTPGRPRQITQPVCARLSIVGVWSIEEAGSYGGRARVGRRDFARWSAAARKARRRASPEDVLTQTAEAALHAVGAVVVHQPVEHDRVAVRGDLDLVGVGSRSEVDGAVVRAWVHGARRLAAARGVAS